jgi:hypothetical protein
MRRKWKFAKACHVNTTRQHYSHKARWAKVNKKLKNGDRNDSNGEKQPASKQAQRRRRSRKQGGGT